jgi:hypothetical protein
LKAEKKRIAEEANAKRSEAAKGQPRNEDGTMGEKPVLVQSAQVLGEQESPGRISKSQASNTNAGAVARGEMTTR